MIPLGPRMLSSEAAMMGRQNGDQASLFYKFRLDERIPKDHLLRRIDVFMTPVLDDMRTGSRRRASTNAGGTPCIATLRKSVPS
jgi:hypothetical protein